MRHIKARGLLLKIHIEWGLMQQNLIRKIRLPIFLALVATGMILACGNVVQTNMSFFIPWPQENGEYQMQYVETSISNLKEISGSEAVFFENPKLVKRGTTGKADITGNTPRTKYTMSSEKKFVPASFNTLNLTTVYAHTEKLNKMYQQISPQSLSLPRKIAVGVTTRDSSMDNNAAYYPGFDTLVIFPFSQEGIPLSLNGGVLAHEYFHAIFYSRYQEKVLKVFPEIIAQETQGSHFCSDETAFVPQKFFDLNQINKDLPNPCDNEGLSEVKLSRFALRGLNEGLADVWGWLYTGDTDFMRHSFGKKEIARKLDGDYLHLLDDEELKGLFAYAYRANKCSEAKASEIIMHYAYLQGTQIARFITAHAKLTKTEKTDTAKRVLKALDNMPIPKSTENQIKTVSFEQFLNSYFKDQTTPKPEECLMLQKLYPAGISICTKK